MERNGDSVKVYQSGILISVVVKTPGHVRTISFANGAVNTTMDVDLAAQASEQALPPDDDDGGDDGSFDCAEAIAKVVYYTGKAAWWCIAGAEADPFCDYYGLKILYWSAKIIANCA